ncbi:alpha/beta fold hydrolase [Vallicoccus soli]|uniref:alpha/beta fold hydrolase n=1 Tax=Vallicoccus soli TaxID=2339232 RepID=UPI001C49C969|nr:alpha/beta hydrolase [Vallicoccus soli]
MVSPLAGVPGWGRRAGVLGAAAGAVAAGALLGVVAERRTVGRSLHRVPEGEHDPYGSGGGEEHVVITADGVPLHAEVDGDDDADVTVVLVHGWALSLRSWWYQRRDLADLGRVVLYDQRGHGRSGRGDRERATIDQLGDDLLHVLDELAPRGPVVLVGHSMGGMTVMALADQHPELFGERVVGVALVSTSPGKLADVTLGAPAAAGRLLRRAVPTVFDQLARRPALVERTRRVGSDLELLLTRRYSFASDVPTSLVEFVSEMISTTPIETVAEFYPAFSAHDKLAALPVLDTLPTLVLVGEDDLLTPPEHSRDIAAAVPTAELVTVPAAGHLVLLEHPGTVTAHLRELVERALGGRP